MSSRAVKLLNIKGIRLSSEFQPRGGVVGTTVKQYADVIRAEGALPPIVVWQARQDYLYVIDGFHRLAAHEQAGESEIEAYVLTGINKKEALQIAALANLSHGKPLTKAEKRDAFRMFINAGGHMGKDDELLSYRELAKKLGMASSSLQRWMRTDFPDIADALSERSAAKHGRTKFTYLAEDDAEDDFEVAVPAVEVSPDEDAVRFIAEYLERVEERYNGLATPQGRGDVVARLEQVLHAFKKAEHVLPDF